MPSSSMNDNLDAEWAIKHEYSSLRSSEATNQFKHERRKLVTSGSSVSRKRKSCSGRDNALHLSPTKKCMSWHGHLHAFLSTRHGPLDTSSWQIEDNESITETLERLLCIKDDSKEHHCPLCVRMCNLIAESVNTATIEANTVAPTNPIQRAILSSQEAIMKECCLCHADLSQFTEVQASCHLAQCIRQTPLQTESMMTPQQDDLQTVSIAPTHVAVMATLLMFYVEKKSTQINLAKLLPSFKQLGFTHNAVQKLATTSTPMVHSRLGPHQQCFGLTGPVLPPLQQQSTSSSSTPNGPLPILRRQRTYSASELQLMTRLVLTSQTIPDPTL